MPLRLVTAATEDANTAALPDAAAVEADHRIANNLAIIAALIRSQAANLPEEPMLPRADVSALLQETSVRIDSVGRLHRLLMHRDGHAVVDLPAYLREIADAAMCSLAGAERTEFSFDLNPHYITSPKQGVAIGLLVGEAITNALKYAHPAGVAGKIQISSRENPDGRFVIEIADDGVGLPEGFDPTVSSGKGLRLMRALAEQLGGRLDFEQGLIGLSVRLEVPPPASLSWAPPDAGVSAQAE
jgi:two-component sensor histidine kinase